MSNLTIEKAKQKGYCIVSRKNPALAARLDRDDWFDVLKENLYRGKKDSAAADQYRRCYSNDVISVPASWVKKLKNSCFGYCEFRE